MIAIRPLSSAPRGLLALVCGLLAALALPAIAHGATRHRGQATSRLVRFDGWHARVPRSWPVYRLAAHPRTCVRFNRHAVYLGTPGAQEHCPAHAAGRTEAVLVSPRPGGSRAHADRAGAATPGARAAGAPTSGAVAQRSSGRVLVTATWDRHPTDVAAALGVRSVQAAGRAYDRREATATRAAAHAASRSHAAMTPDATAASTPEANTSTAGEVYTGLGFDACSAPSSSAMRAWASSPFRAVGVYIGGENMACNQGNLTASWASAQAIAGWHLIPIYVGPQAPGNGCGCAAISPSAATSEGDAAADGAIEEAEALGLDAGNPIYYDMENYTRTTTASDAVLTFLQAWTSTLHSAGYASGVYSSELSGIEDLVAQAGTGYAEPDDIWIANWNGEESTSDPKVPAADWPDHQRLHQYRGGHTDDYGGTDIDIDSDYVDAATAAPGAGSLTTTIAAAPTIKVSPQAAGTIKLSPSWAGEGGITHWRILAGSNPTDLATMLTVPASHRTVVTHNAEPYFQVQALGASGEELGSSGTTATRPHVAIFGQSAYVPSRGAGGLAVECFGISPCKVTATIRSGGKLLKRTAPAHMAADGGVLHFGLTTRAHQRVADARRRGLPVTITVRTSTGRSAKRAMRLVPYAVSGKGPRRVAGASPALRTVGETEFVSGDRSGHVLVACLRDTPCMATPALTAGGHTIATAREQKIGAGELDYLSFTMTSTGRALLRRAAGNQLGATVKVVVAGQGLDAPRTTNAHVALAGF